jgi:mRNA-degrading endonuclease RelE of RelBE toxin-antitoxin system
VYTFIETPLFTRLVSEHLTDEEYAALQDALAADPESGALIRGSGGLRKLRWSVRGRGKRGGVRVIYYLRDRAGVIWMLTIYAKNVAGSIPTHVLRKIAQEIEDGEAQA